MHADFSALNFFIYMVCGCVGSFELCCAGMGKMQGVVEAEG